MKQLITVLPLTWFARVGYVALAQATRPFGGVRPFRIMNWLRSVAWKSPPNSNDFFEVTDRWGCKLCVHPFYLIDHHIFAKGTYDPVLHNFVNKNIHYGSIVFDIGANIGSVALHLSKKAGINGKVVCFEPVSHIRERCAKNIALNDFGENIVLEPLGIWNVNTDLEIDVPAPSFPNHGCSSLGMRFADSLKETIAVMSLDSYVEKYAVKKVDWIKFDIQGAESVALQGARETMRKFRPRILTEVSPEDLQAFGTTSRAYLQQFADSGYNVYRINANGAVGALLNISKVQEREHFSNVICIHQGAL